MVLNAGCCHDGRRGLLDEIEEIVRKGVVLKDCLGSARLSSRVDSIVKI